jgi:protein tyrosine phosphatase
MTNLNENKKRNMFICQYTDDIQSVQTQSNELTYFNQFNRLQTFMNLIHIYHQKGPLMVYCLNGLGRTGLFLCIYYYLTLFKTDFFSNSTNNNFIFDTVKLLRTQRFGVIQTKEQYKYCYTFFLQLFSQKLNALNNQVLQSA